MLQTLLISDTHLEFYKDNGNKFTSELIDINPELLIIAGDFGNFPNSISILSVLLENIKDIVFVPGNHDYYNSDLSEVNTALYCLNKNYSNFHFLNNSKTTIKGRTFIGATLWYPRPLGISDFQLLNHSLNDFKKIKQLPQDLFKAHSETRDYLEQNISKGDIVVTHHMPSLRCISSKYIDNPLNCFFASNQEFIIRSKKPAYWFFGHTHSSMEFTIGSTLLKSNPKGYPSEVTNFSLNLIEL